MRSLHCIVRGKVQGGNFQAWLQKQAEVLGLTGWVRNIADCEAEILAQGNPDKFKDFEEIIRTEAPLPEVESITFEEIDYDKSFDVFQIRG